MPSRVRSTISRRSKWAMAPNTWNTNSPAADEVKDIRDKARAIEVYAQQALNVEAERQASQIRLRAERRCGQLLRQREKAKGAQGTGSNQYQVRSDDTTAPQPQT